MTDYDVIVVGGGHNGLACACYLARTGLSVLVLEQADEVGGAVRTAATIPGLPAYRFDTCSVVHNLLQTTTIAQELCLAEAGLRYVENDPWLTSIFPDGACLRFYRSVERTCEEIARYSPHDAEAYWRFVRLADPLIELSLEAFRASEDGGRGWPPLRRLLQAARRVLAAGHPVRLIGEMLGPYASLLEERFTTEYVRAGIAVQGAHGALGPHVPGTAFFILWQAAFHRYGSWHAIGGSGALSIALRRRLEAWGGTVRTGARVQSIQVDGRARGVRLADGETIGARRAVVAAINPRTALFDLVGEQHLTPDLVRRLRARHRSNAVHFLAFAALDRLPPWTALPASDVYHGMQTVAASLDQVRENFVRAEAGLAPARPAVYLVTSSALDSTLVPPGGHTAYLACAAYPARWADGTPWEAHAEQEANRLVDAVEARAPGFRGSIQGLAWRHAEMMEREIGLVGGHPMHLDVTPDQVGPLRPLPELASHRTPLAGLYLSGAGTAPTGGVSGVPGRAAARTVLRDLARAA